MRKNKEKSKLSLNKIIVSKLTQSQQNKIKGGEAGGTVEVIVVWPKK